jgi:hypothetical protein
MKHLLTLNFSSFLRCHWPLSGANWAGKSSRPPKKATLCSAVHVAKAKPELSSGYKILVRDCHVDSTHSPSLPDTACKNAHLFTPDSFVERIHSYQKVHGVVSNRDVSIMATLMTAIVAIHTAMWATVRRRRPRLAQTRWGLPSPASPLMNLAYQIGSGTSLEITGTGTQTWLPTITLVAATP